MTWNNDYKETKGFLQSFFDLSAYNKCTNTEQLEENDKLTAQGNPAAFRVSLWLHEGSTKQWSLFSTERPSKAWLMYRQATREIDCIQ